MEQLPRVKFNHDKQHETVGPIPKEKQVVSKVFNLAGTTFTNYPFETLIESQPVTLVLDPMGTNTQPHPDPTAVAVLDLEGKHIAYIKKSQAQHIFPMLESGTLKAESTIHEIKGGGDYNWGIDIYVKFTEV